jgi:hypothetical protein
VALKTVVAPKRVQTALTEVLPSLVQFLQQNPQVGVHHHDVHDREIKLWLPVYVGTAPVSSRSRRKRASTRARLAAKRIAWLCFLKTRQGVNAAIELQVERSGSIRHQFQQGEFIQHAFARMRAAARDQRLRGGAYTARLLNIPGMYFSALWFKSASREQFVALVSIGNEVKAGGFYSRSEIVRALNDEASRRKEAHQIILARKRQVSSAADSLS